MDCCWSHFFVIHYLFFFVLLFHRSESTHSNSFFFCVPCIWYRHKYTPTSPFCILKLLNTRTLIWAIKPKKSSHFTLVLSVRVCLNEKHSQFKTQHITRFFFGKRFLRCVFSFVGGNLEIKTTIDIVYIRNTNNHCILIENLICILFLLYLHINVFSSYLD